MFRGNPSHFESAGITLSQSPPCFPSSPVAQGRVLNQKFQPICCCVPDAPLPTACSFTVLRAYSLPPRERGPLLLPVRCAGISSLCPSLPQVAFPRCGFRSLTLRQSFRFMPSCLFVSSVYSRDQAAASSLCSSWYLLSLFTGSMLC